MKIAVVGTGAVGCYYGARLAQQNPDIHFLLRSDYDTIKQSGLKVLSPDGDFTLHDVNAHFTSESNGDFTLHDVNAHFTSESMGACDLVIIAVKATANRVLLNLLQPLLHENTMLLTLQNGLGNEEFLAEHYGGERVLGGKCFVCLNRIAPGVIKHIGHGVITLGEFRRKPMQRTHDLAQMFESSGVPCQVCDDIEEVLWRKLTWNIPFNGLSIACGENRIGIDVGQILADEKLQMLTRELIREVIAIAATQGVLIEDDYVDFQIERTKPMGAYKPSSLLDWEAGREVEVEPIWGEPLRHAQQASIEAPRLKRLYQQLLRLTSQN